MESSAELRSDQWSTAEPLVLDLFCAEVTMAAAMSMAPSHSAAALSGDQPIAVTPGGGDESPSGSKTMVWPEVRLRDAVAAMTSGLVEVSTTAPGALRTLGMITLDVLPDRVGPRTRVLR